MMSRHESSILELRKRQVARVRIVRLLAICSSCIAVGSLLPLMSIGRSLTTVGDFEVIRVPVSDRILRVPDGTIHLLAITFAISGFAAILLWIGWILLRARRASD